MPISTVYVPLDNRDRTLLNNLPAVWEANTLFAEGQQVTYGNMIYAFNATTTTGATFSLGEVTPVGGAGVSTPLFQGTIAATDALPTGTSANGYMWRFSSAGMFQGEAVEIGDVLISMVQSPAVFTDFTIIQKNSSSATSAQNRLYLTATMVGAAIPSSPTLAEIRLATDTAALTDIIAYYTGDDGPASEPTHVYHVDASGIVTLIQEPAGTAVANVRAHITDTATAPALAATPTLAEAQAAITTATLTDTIVYYTGDDLPTSSPTYVYHVDSAGTATVVLQPVTGSANNRAHLTATVVAAAAIATPTLAEIQAASTAAALTDTHAYYTGDDLPASEPTYVYHIDAAGVATVVLAPASLANDRGHLTATAVAAVSVATPSLAEIQAAVTAANITDTHVFYTGDDLPASPITYVYHVDASGTVTVVVQPATADTPSVYPPFAGSTEVQVGELRSLVHLGATIFMVSKTLHTTEATFDATEALLWEVVSQNQPCLWATGQLLFGDLEVREATTTETYRVTTGTVLTAGATFSTDVLSGDLVRANHIVANDLLNRAKLWMAAGGGDGLVTPSLRESNTGLHSVRIEGNGATGFAFYGLSTSAATTSDRNIRIKMVKDAANDSGVVLRMGDSVDGFADLVFSPKNGTTDTVVTGSYVAPIVVSNTSTDETIEIVVRFPFNALAESFVLIPDNSTESGGLVASSAIGLSGYVDLIELDLNHTVAAVAGANNRVLVSETSVAPATATEATLAEIQAAVTTATLTDVFIIYTGTDLATDTILQTYHADASGVVTLVNDALAGPTRFEVNTLALRDAIVTPSHGDQAWVKWPNSSWFYDLPTTSWKLMSRAFYQQRTVTANSLTPTFDFEDGSAYYEVNVFGSSSAVTIDMGTPNFESDVPFMVLELNNANTADATYSFPTTRWFRANNDPIGDIVVPAGRKINMWFANGKPATGSGTSSNMILMADNWFGPAGANNRAHLTATAVGAALTVEPTLAEIQAAVTAATLTDVVVYYTGDDLPVSQPLQVFHADNSGVVTYLWSVPRIGRLSERVNQTAHGLVALDVVRRDTITGLWVKAQANAVVGEAQGIVETVYGVDDFDVIMQGKLHATAHGLTVGEYYWTDQDTAGVSNILRPDVGIIQSLFYVIDIDTLLVDPSQPVEISAAVTAGRLHLSSTLVAAADINYPTVAEISTAVGGNKNILVYYTGDDLPASDPTFVYNVDANSVVTTVDSNPPWVDYAITIGGSAAAPVKGTITVDRAQYKVVGKTLHLRYDYEQSAAGSAGSGNYLFPLPAGMVPDLPVGGGTLLESAQVVGSSMAFDGTTIAHGTVRWRASFGMVDLAVGNPNNFIGVGDTFFSLNSSAVCYSFTATIPLT